MKTCFPLFHAAAVRISRSRVSRGLLSIFAMFLSLLFFTALTPGDECRSGLAAFEKMDYETAVKHFTDGAVEGDQAARLMLGLCYNEGFGVKKDVDKSMKLFQEAAKSDDAVALLFLGAMLMDDEDGGEGLDYLKKSADKGCAVAQFQVACLYLEKDEAKAVEYFKKAAVQSMTDEKTLVDYVPEINEAFENQELKIKLKSSNATNYAIIYSQIMLGSAYKGGLFGVKEDEAKAEEWYAKARKNGWDESALKDAEKEDDDSEYRKGLAALDRKDYETAVKYFTEGSVEDDLNCRLMLGYCCDAGLGMKADTEKTLRILRPIADSGDENAMTFLALVLIGLEQEDGMTVLKMAADKGYATAQFMYGCLIGVDAKSADGEKKALEYFRKAAAQPMTGKDTPLDHMRAALGVFLDTFKIDQKKPNLADYSIVASQIMIGSFYEQGKGGLKKDTAKAEEWYAKARKNGWIEGKNGGANAKTDGSAGAEEYEKGVDAFKKKDYVTAVEHFNKSVEAGNGEAMLLLSYCLSNALGVEKDEARSEKLAKDAAKSGNRNAIAVFGASMCGEGKKEDGMALLKEAAGKGCAYAQFILGTLYSMDDNGEKAVEYFSMAATQLMTEEEVVFDLIPEMADTLKKQTLKLNLKNGNITNISIVSSQIMLGAAYGSGLWGIEQDKEIAKEWYKLAGRNGWADADKAIKALDE